MHVAEQVVKHCINTYTNGNGSVDEGKVHLSPQSHCHPRLPQVPVDILEHLFPEGENNLFVFHPQLLLYGLEVPDPGEFSRRQCQAGLTKLDSCFNVSHLSVWRQGGWVSSGLSDPGQDIEP